MCLKNDRFCNQQKTTVLAHIDIQRMVWDTQGQGAYQRSGIVGDVEWITLDEALSDFFIEESVLLSKTQELDSRVTVRSGERFIHVMRHQISRAFPRRERSLAQSLSTEAKLIIYPVVAAAVYDVAKRIATEHAPTTPDRERISSRAEVANALVQMRAAAGLSQRELEVRSGLSISKIARLEAPDGPVPSIDILSQYARGCGFELAPSLMEPARASRPSEN